MIRDARWMAWHDAIRDLTQQHAKAAMLQTELEPRNVAGEARPNARPADLMVKGDSNSHGCKETGTRNLLIDFTVVSSTLPIYRRAAAGSAARAAAQAADLKRFKALPHVTEADYFLPIPTLADGTLCADHKALVKFWAKRWADVTGQEPRDAARLYARWQDDLAILNARMLARCLLHRAAASRAQCAERAGMECAPPMPPTQGETDLYHVTLTTTTAGRGH